MQGQSVQINEIVQLAALALLIGSATTLAKVCSPGYRSTNHPKKPKEESELLREFNQLNAEAQGGAIRYIKEMRKGYQRSKSRD